MSCRERVLDVFVTKDSSDYKNEFDDQYVGPVWSVEVGVDAGGHNEATVVNAATEWISFSAFLNDPGIRKGDLVRIGVVSATGYTDYCTVLEVKEITRLRNGVALQKAGTEGNDKTHFLRPALQYPTHHPGTNLEIVAVGEDEVSVKNASSAPNGQGGDSFHTVPGPHPTVGGLVGATPIILKTYAYRLNFSLNCTKPPTPSLSIDTGAELLFDLMQKRHEVEFDNPVDPSNPLRCYPLFKVKKWLTESGDIQCRLDHGVKSLQWIKLVGYSVFNKRQVGFAHGHEVINDDWVAMHINEVEGKVVSNNQYAQGAFAVLHVGGSPDNVSGAIEFYNQDPHGLYTHYFDNHKSVVRNLTIKFLDRTGEPAHFGRVHLWFKLCVSHG